MHRPQSEKNPKRSFAARNRCQQCCEHCRKNHRKCDGQDPCISCRRSRTQCVRIHHSSGGQEIRRRPYEAGLYDEDTFTQRYGQHFFVKHRDGYLVVFDKGGDCYAAYLNEHYQTISPHRRIGPKHFALEYSRNFTVDELLNVDSTAIDALFIKSEPTDYPSPSSDDTSSTTPSPSLKATLIDYSRERLHSGSAVYRGGFKPPG